MKKFLISIFCIFLFSTQAIAQKINVAFTIDNNYPIYTLLVINSILKNNTSNSDYTFYIVENNLSFLNKIKMKRYVEKRKQKIEFININTDKIDKGKWFYGFSKRITSIAMVRILLPEIMPANVDRVLYLDGDILVLKDLKELYNTDMEGKAFAMAPNISDYKSVKIFSIGKTYYNSGVILMDLNKCRKEKVTAKMLKFVNNNFKYFIYDKKGHKSFLYPDQDLINIVMKDNIKTLSKKWNAQYIYGCCIWKFDDSGIIHYIGPQKPWGFYNFSDEFIKAYFKYWDEASLRRYKMLYGIGGIKTYYISSVKFKIKRFKTELKDMKIIH